MPNLFFFILIFYFFLRFCTRGRGGCADSTFAWVGAEKCECIFLNDFRWSSTLIQWHDFLLMLEGQPVHLTAPKSHYAKDLVLDEDTPIFATGKRPLIYMKNGVVDERETDMMSVRWVVYNFHVQVPREDQKELLPCGKCFARVHNRGSRIPRSRSFFLKIPPSRSFFPKISIPPRPTFFCVLIIKQNTKKGIATHPLVIINC